MFIELGSYENKTSPHYKLNCHLVAGVFRFLTECLFLNLVYILYANLCYFARAVLRSGGLCIKN